MAKRKSVLIGDLIPILSLILSIIITILIILGLFISKDKRRKRVLTSQDTKILSEIRDIKQALSQKFDIDLDEKAFDYTDCYEGLFAIDCALHTFEDTKAHKEIDQHIRMEARGYVSLLKLLISWADSKKETGLKKKAKELLKRAESIHNSVNTF